MNMGQRTSSAVELNSGRQKQNDEAFLQAVKENADEVTKWGTPVSMLEFSPAAEPTIGLVYLKPQSKTVHGEWVIFDGFYLDSRGGRPSIALAVPEVLIQGTYPQEANVPVTITKAGAGIYFLTRDMAEYCLSKVNESGIDIQFAANVCHAKTFNNLLDQLEDGDQAGHFEDGTVLIVNAETPDKGNPVMIGITEVLVNKKLHLVHVVAELDVVPQFSEGKALKYPHDLINAAYYSSEKVARYGYQDRVLGRKSLDNLMGREYPAMVQHLTRSAK